MKILVTGGAGYIGSTVCSALEDKGHTPIIIDSLITGKKNYISNRIFYKGDISEKEILTEIFRDHPEIHTTIHCAGLIIVPESSKDPYKYYNENLIKSIQLFNNLLTLGQTRLIFSSTASLYKSSDGTMVTEKSELLPQSPYARTKMSIEMVLKDFSNSYNFKAISLRYFNPIGADPKMRTGPHTQNPSHVVGKLIESINSESNIFTITGTNWNTRDGTGIRDYVHVWDLAQAHVSAIEYFDNIVTQDTPYNVINLGTGEGTTVLELVTAFEEINGTKIIKVSSPPRQGDVAGGYTNRDKALNLLKWTPRMSIEQGLADALKWFNKNNVQSS
ncbi:MAG: UDP-glucose 4-epimerase GalE [Chloroflexi bacterium]|nr:UDP-glucose 4-epimerase GalE [Chloroflexota bacterium]